MLAILTRFMVDQGGKPPLVWYPAALILVGVLFVCALVMPPRLAEQPRSMKVAAGLLLGYAVWCALSIRWAHDQGAAWDGANQATLYLVIYVLVAGYRQRTVTATSILTLFALIVSVVALVAALSLEGPGGYRHLWGLRAADPTGYPNASAALFMMAFWPALALAGRAELSPAVRGSLAGGAAILLEASLLTESRGALYSLPLVTVAFFAICPGRVRSLLTLLPIAVAVGITAPHSLHALDHIVSTSPRLALDTIPGPLLIAAVAVSAINTIVALIERARPIPPGLADRGRRVVGTVTLGLIVVAVVGGLFAIRDPVARARNAWSSFRHAGEPTANVHGSARLAIGLGSQRYDVYRVALHLFATHPLQGVGVDNFAQEYLQQRRGSETPHYPHSLEFRLLAETGVVGTALGGGAIVAGLVAAAGAIRRRRRSDGGGAGALPCIVAASATVAVVFWLVHGSFDWFWEFPVLGGAAWMLLGLAAGLAPRPASPVAAPVRRWPAIKPSGGPTMVGTVVIIAACALFAVSLVNPWLAGREVDLATRVAAVSPDRALDNLGRATSLNPLDGRAQLIAASINAQLGQLDAAVPEVAAALRGDDTDEYAWLLQGAILSAQGNRGPARASLQRAVALNPRDTIARDALSRAQKARADPVAILRQVAAERPQ